MQAAIAPSLQFAISALQSGRLRDAERLARDYLATQPANEDALLLLSMCLMQQGRLGEATSVCRQLTQLAPQSAVYWSNLGTVLRDAGELRDAEQAYRQAVALDPTFFGTLINLGYLLLDTGNYPEAGEIFGAALALDPASPEARIYAAQAAIALDHREVAAQLIAPWRSWTQLSEDLTVDLAGLMIAAGTAIEAARIFEDLLRRNPNNLRATANLVNLYERTNRLDEAQALLKRLPPAESIDDPKLRFEVIGAFATFALRDENPARGRELLEKLIGAFHRSPGSKHTPWRVVDLYFSVAKTYDKEGNVDAAMASLAEAHKRRLTLARKVVPKLFEPGVTPLHMATARLKASSYAAWQDYPAPSMLESPIFVAGFPRSGTTMLEQMLDAHPNLQSMDERGFLSSLINHMSTFDCTYPDDLGKLSAEQCDQLRRMYWSAAAKVAPRQNQQRLVDKNPLHMLRAALIKRLFPNAPIILALRHPCDVILSNYMQYFTSNSFAVLRSSLERVAQGYVNAMESWIHHADLLELNVIYCRYEDLLDDFPGNIRRIGDFLQLDDSAPMARFDQHARAKGFISTASYAQVVEPPNKKAIGRWRRYHKYFEPVLPILQPIMQHWGYHD